MDEAIDNQQSEITQLKMQLLDLINHVAKQNNNLLLATKSGTLNIRTKYSNRYINNRVQFNYYDCDEIFREIISYIFDLRDVGSIADIVQQQNLRAYKCCFMAQSIVSVLKKNANTDEQDRLQESLDNLIGNRFDCLLKPFSIHQTNYPGRLIDQLQYINGDVPDDIKVSCKHLEKMIITGNTYSAEMLVEIISTRIGDLLNQLSL